VRKLASSWHAKILLGLTILLHLVLTILATDITVEKGATIPIFIQLGLHFCLFLFFADLCLRLFDEKLEFFACKLNVFDTCVVAADILTEIMSYWDQSHIPSLSALRMLRAVRVVRVVGFLSDIRELYLMLHGIASAMKAIMWGAFLIGILTLVWAIMAVELIHPLTLQLAAAGDFESCEKCTSAFSSVGSAFFNIRIDHSRRRQLGQSHHANHGCVSMDCSFFHCGPVFYKFGIIKSNSCSDSGKS